jgi:aromatic ring hydroxylase
MARRKKEGTGQSIAGALFRADRLEKSINSNLLELGRVYCEGAAREVIDREKHQHYADQAFKVLAMIYQRAHSGEALNLMREVNGIQRDYLHRLARTNWKRAQLAAAAGLVDKANESYYVATQRYLQCMSQSVETRRELVAKEFRILKKEIVEWKTKKKTAPVKAAGD